MVLTCVISSNGRRGLKNDAAERLPYMRGARIHAGELGVVPLVEMSRLWHGMEHKGAEAKEAGGEEWYSMRIRNWV